MNRMDYTQLVNRVAFWALVIAIALFTMAPFLYAISISLRTNPQVLVEAKYLPEGTNFERQYNLDRIQIVDIVNPGDPENEYIEIQNQGPRTIDMEGWRLTSSADYEFVTIPLDYDPNNPDQEYSELDPVRDRTLRLSRTLPVGDAGSVFVAAGRAFDPAELPSVETSVNRSATLERSYDVTRYNTIDEINFEFEVVVDYFTEFVFPSVELESGDFLKIYTGPGSNTDSEVYIGLQPGMYQEEEVFTGTLWNEAEIAALLTSEAGISQASFPVGTDRIYRVQIVDQVDIGEVRYATFGEFMGDYVFGNSDRRTTFLSQFGGGEADASLFSGLEEVDELEDALEVYAESASGFDLDAAESLIGDLEDALTPEAFTTIMQEAGVDEGFTSELVAQASNVSGERVIVENFGDAPVSLEGWRLSNAQQARSQFDLPAATIEANSTLALISGYGLNTEDAIYVRSEGPIWESENVANLTDTNELRRSRYIVEGEVYALRNYSNLVQDDTFLRNMWNSAIVSTVSVTLSLVVGSFAAYALGRVRFRGQYLILYLVLAMTMFPQISILSGMFEIVNDLDIYNTNLAMIFSYPIFTLPFTVWVLTSFFQGLPGEIEQAALVDGATAFQTFWRILVPLTAPALVTTGLLAFIAAWNEYLFALTFTLGEDQRTVPVAIAQFSGFDREEAIADKIAAAVVVTIPLLILVLFFQRRIVEGLTAGAVKG